MGDKKTAANSALNAGDSGDFGDGAPNATTLAFGPFEVDLALRTLRRDGAPVTLGARPFALLEILLRHAPAPVAHNVVRRHVWPGTHVADNNLRVQLWHLRQALGDDASRPQYVETLVGVGYRFVAPVRRGAMDAPDDRAAVHAAPIDPARRGWLRVAAMGLIGLAAGGAGTAWLLRGDDEPAIDLPRAIAYERSPGYGAYVRARRAWTQRSRDGLAAAMADYRRALARDPRFAPAMAGLAEA
ncbi:MAG: winged helix-turn-helix domain-containing protein, partial [Acidobacteriota bacterium]